MIQEIGNHHYNNSYRPQPPSRSSFILHYEERTALVLKRGEDISFARFGDLEPENPDLYQKWIYLFSIDDDRFYLVTELTFPAPDTPLPAAGAVLPSLSASDRTEPAPANGDAAVLPVFAMVNIMEFRGAHPRFLGFAGITGFQLSQWYSSRRFCGRCGAPLRQDEKERMMRCDSCGQLEYPKICPAVIIGVRDKNRLLLTKYAGREYKRYALVAGFCEIGETVEETVQREVMEEVGLKVTNLQYYKSQPWSFTDTLLMGFFCDLAEPAPIRLQEDELASAEWFEREDVPLEDPTRAALTQQMIREFKEGRW